MKKNGFPRFLIIVVAVALAAGLSTVASAEVTQNVRVPFNSVITNDCLGEPVELTGELHLILSVQETGNGVRLSQHSNPVGVFGTGLNSGASFRGIGVTKLTTFIDAEPPYDVTFVNNFTIKGLDDAKTSRIHQNIHVSVNAQNEITASVDNLKTTCK